jgi:DNA (cytosine-5)-methyltransferase 1
MFVNEPPCGWNAEDRRARIDDPSAAAPTVSTHGRGWNQMAIQGQVERRKFTIAELKRICAFPDDFILVGSYAQQWERLGNSVPPVMMRYIAEAVRDGVLLKRASPS